MVATQAAVATQPVAHSPTTASKLLGISYDTALYWLRNGLIRASIQHEQRQWSPVLFSFEDLTHLRLVQLLRDYGQPYTRIKKAVRLARKSPAGELLLSGDTVIPSDSPLRPRLDDQEVVLRVSLLAVRQYVRNQAYLHRVTL